MAEYISREDYCEAECSKENREGYKTCKNCSMLNVTSADVQPVKWISVNDRLPDTPEQGMDAKYSDCCLVCDEFGWIDMGYYMTDGKKSCWEFADAQNKNKIDWTEITHWMPLPEPPKDGEDNGSDT